jgi:uncharacterized membrane protein YqjE
MDRNSTVVGNGSAREPLDSMAALQQRAASLWLNAKGLVHDQTLLALLEVQRAGTGLVKMIAAAVAISVLAISAWMGVVAACVAWAVYAGANWGVAIIVAAIANLVVAVLLGLWVRAQVPELLFAATVWQLRGERAPGEDPTPRVH